MENQTSWFWWWPGALILVVLFAIPLISAYFESPRYQANRRARRHEKEFPGEDLLSTRIANHYNELHRRKRND